MTRSTNKNERFASPLAWGFIGLASLAWVLVNVYISTRFRFPNSDSIMYGLPLTVSKGPFDLKIPYLGDFESYGRVWGHQWPGAMWIRAGIFGIIPFARELDMSFYLICQWLSAVLAAGLVWKSTSSRWPTVGTAVLAISDRLSIMSLELHRFEAIGVLSLVALFNFSWRLGPAMAWPWYVAGYTAAFFSPTVHPYTGPLGALVLAILLIKAFVFRECDKRDALLACGFFVVGLIALVLWYALQPEAWEQYRRNVELQMSFSKSFNVVWSKLAVGYRFQSGRILWGLALLASMGLLAGRPTSLKCIPGFSFLRLALPGMILGIIFIQTVTRCNNYSYFVVATPFVGAALAIMSWGLFQSSGRPIGYALAAAFFALVLLWSMIFPYRIYQYARVGYPDVRRVTDEILLDIPQGRKVYFPPPFWDSVTRLHLNHDYRQWTFAVASSEDRRKRYENKAYADVAPGDILIVDHLSLQVADTWGFLPTKNILPPDERKWKLLKTKKRLFPGATEFGYDFEIYEYVGP